jgi:hypothetical protein
MPYPTCKSNQSLALISFLNILEYRHLLQLLPMNWHSNQGIPNTKSGAHHLDTSNVDATITGMSKMTTSG